jgi:predicted DNA binding CopG/RHH family protein
MSATNKKRLPLPRFKNEDEEREFWAAHDSADYLNWENAQKAVFPNLKTSTSHISLRLPQSLLDELKAAANARDVPYQSLMKIWLAEKIAENSFPRTTSKLKQSKS